MRSAIRLATPSDGQAVADIYRPSVTDSAVSFELDPPDAAEMEARIRTTLTRTPWLVLEADGGTLGYAYASRHRERPAYQWSVDVSAYVRPDARRAGVARALYGSLLEILTLQGFRNAYAGITLPNAGSVALHETAGFLMVGVFRSVGYKLGAWHDVAWFERRLSLHHVDPAPPVPLSDLIGTPRLERALAAGLAQLKSGATRSAW